MHDSIQYIIVALKAARISKGLSQRALSDKTGISQSHISKIEKGLVDLQLSSFILIARVLDLEPMLVPRNSVAMFQTLLSGNKKNRGQQIPVYRLDEEELMNNSNGLRSKLSYQNQSF